MIVSSQNDKNTYQILSDVEELLHKQAAGGLTAKVFTAVQTEFGTIFKCCCLFSICKSIYRKQPLSGRTLGQPRCGNQMPPMM